MATHTLAHPVNCTSQVRGCGGGSGAARGAGRAPHHGGRARSHCRFVLPLIHFIPDLLRDLVPLFLKQRCNRTLHGGRLRHRAR